MQWYLEQSARALSATVLTNGVLAESVDFLILFSRLTVMRPPDVRQTGYHEVSEKIDITPWRLSGQNSVK
jgi:hypothetical protein